MKKNCKSISDKKYPEYAKNLMCNNKPNDSMKKMGEGKEQILPEEDTEGKWTHVHKFIAIRL